MTRRCRSDLQTYLRIAQQIKIRPERKKSHIQLFPSYRDYLNRSRRRPVGERE